MKNLILALVLFCVACASQAQVDAGHALAEATVRATDPTSDGGAAITPDEEAQIRALYADLVGAEGIDWREVGGGVVASLALLFPALRLLPNRFFLGNKEGAALDKLAKKSA